MRGRRSRVGSIFDPDSQLTLPAWTRILLKPVTRSLVQQAIHTGYRHLDCACDYGNDPRVSDCIVCPGFAV